MKKYYTRVCNFYYGNISKKLVKQKKTLPLNGSAEISFDHIEILSRNSKTKIHIKKRIELLSKVKVEDTQKKREQLQTLSDNIKALDEVESISEFINEASNIIYSVNTEKLFFYLFII